jgi:hypothetical protein
MRINSMKKENTYETPKVRIIQLAGLEAILNASAKGGLPDAEEDELDFIF